MADNFRQFSEQIADIKPAEREWIRSVLGCQDNVAPTLKNHGIRVPHIDVDYWPGFQWQLEEDDTHLWLYAEESGNIEHVAEFVRAFLARFCPKASWYLTWADTCSKPRLSEFSGGGLFVTAKRITFFSATDDVRRAQNRFEALRDRKRSIR